MAYILSGYSNCLMARRVTDQCVSFIIQLTLQGQDGHHVECIHVGHLLVT